MKDWEKSRLTDEPNIVARKSKHRRNSCFRKPLVFFRLLAKKIPSKYHCSVLIQCCRNVFIVSLSLDVSKLSSRQVNKHTITIKYCSKAGSNLQNNDYNGKSISTAMKRKFCTTTFQRKWKTFKIEPLVLIEHHWEASSEKTRANWLYIIQFVHNALTKVDLYPTER